MKLSIRDLLVQAPVIPVIQISDSRLAVPMAKALAKGGLTTLEIVLRTPESLDAIKNIRAEVEGVVVGAGTVLNTEHFSLAQAAGSEFIVTPGLTQSMLKTAAETETPILPGVATASELMLGLENGLDTFKFFPAETSGGAGALKALSGPFQHAQFCPTGGISLDNISNYLALDCVLTVGGSWLTPADLVQAQDWDAITTLAQRACKQVAQLKSASNNP